MNEENIISNIEQELLKGRNVDLQYKIRDIPYKVKFMCPDYQNGINISGIVAIPLVDEFNKQLIVEANNMESENFAHVLKQGIYTGIRLANLTKELPPVIVIPLIPSFKNAPYFQQLSKECFELSEQDIYYRIDKQIEKMIKKARKIATEEKDTEFDEKIFLNGYSTSGVFAQKFALLHPELVEVACIGGASGSIPVLNTEIGYPIGIKDYEKLTGKEFNLEEYKKIKFRYYVGEYETQNKSNLRTDDFLKPAPMNDMSYFDRSVPLDVGKNKENYMEKKCLKEPIELSIL